MIKSFIIGGELTGNGSILYTGQNIYYSPPYYVRDSMGLDTNDGETPGTAWLTIQKAANTMIAGDIVYVGPTATQYGSVTIGVSGTTDLFRIIYQADPNGTNTTDTPGVLSVAGDSFSLTGKSFITIDGFTTNPGVNYGIWLVGSSDIIISNNEIVGQGIQEYGIYLSNSSNITIENNIILEVGIGKDDAGINIGNGANISILNNQIYHAIFGTNGNGIEFNINPSNGIIISGNEIYNCGRGDNTTGGIRIRQIITNSSITNNLIYNNRTGISATCCSLTFSTLIIDNNQIYSNNSYGIDDLDFVILKNNTIYSNGSDGIRDANSATISNNTIYNNSDGIANSNNAIIYNNVIYSNTNNGIYIIGDTLTIQNNLIYNNSSGIYANNATAVVISILNNTIFGNTNDGIEIFDDYGVFTIKDNIIENNGDRGIELTSIVGGGATFAIDYNHYYGNTTSNFFNLSAGTNDNTSELDPLFVDSVGADFHVLITSPTLDSGSDSTLNILLPDSTPLSDLITRSDGVKDGTSPDGAIVNLGYHYP